MNSDQNPITIFFSQFAQKINNSNGTLRVIEHILKLGSNPENIKKYFNGSIVIISDISDVKNNVFHKLYPIDKTYYVDESLLQNEIKMLIEQANGYAIANSFESFYSFLKKVSRTVIGEPIPEHFTNWKPKDHFKMLKEKLPELEQIMESNIRGDFDQYFKVLKFFRDKQTHSNGRFENDDKEYKKFNEVERDILNNLFPHYKNEEHLNIFMIDLELAARHFKWMAEFAFIFYKTASKYLNYDVKIESYLSTPPN